MISAERLRGVEVITFDCYGTLIDWETGILEALRPILRAYCKSLEDQALLSHYAQLEAQIEAGPFLRYREVLAMVVDGLGESLGFSPTAAQRGALAEGLVHWKPFADTVEALRALSRRFRLGVISNVDADLFAATAEKLEVPFDWIVLAEQVGAYKPSARNFVTAIEATGRPANAILHAAQSVYHDVIPARVLGLATALITRRGAGAAKPAEAAADFEVPDLKALAQALL